MYLAFTIVTTDLRHPRRLPGQNLNMYDRHTRDTVTGQCWLLARSHCLLQDSKIFARQAALPASLMNALNEQVIINTGNYLQHGNYSLLRS